ncbi:MAG: hypothetical protein Fur0032_15030 [Terrimicrobiaceae bacterium]
MLALNRNDPVVSAALTLGVYEVHEIQFFRRYFRAGMTFVDVGANLGLYTALVIRQQAAHILCVEPHPEAYDYLLATIRLNSGHSTVVTRQVAASSVAGEVELFSNPDNKGDNRIYPDPLLRSRVKVPTARLDELCLSAHIDRIDFLKVDVQGTEGKVLEGAGEILKKSPNCIMMLEFWPQGLRACESEPSAFLDSLATPGRRLFEMVGNRLIPAEPSRLLSTTAGRRYRNLVSTGPSFP